MTSEGIVKLPTKARFSPWALSAALGQQTYVTSADPDLKQRFEREAKTISSLNHPHICTLYDIGEQDGIDFLVMEYLEGDTLAQRLERGALPLDQALKVAIETGGPDGPERRRCTSSLIRLRLRSLATSPSSTTPPDPPVPPVSSPDVCLGVWNLA